MTMKTGVLSGSDQDSPATLPSWRVYFVRCADGTLYTGITTELLRRVRQHNGELSGGARYTASRRPVELVYSQTCDTRSEAAKAEYRLRRLPKKEKLALIRRASDPE